MEASVDFFFEGGVPSLSVQAGLSEVVQRICRDRGRTLGWLNVILLPTAEHMRMNAAYLDHHYETDILTFPFEESETIGGEIYINEDVARENAKAYGVSLENELSRLVIHGTLHLVGLDDHVAEEKEKMTAEENKYLSCI